MSRGPGQGQGQGQGKGYGKPGYEGPGPIPARWLECPRKGSALLCDKFLPFKTPLSQKFDPQVPLPNRFPPKMLFASMKSHKVKLGLWINLTFTSRFYDKAEVEEMGCQYKQLECRGHGETPSPEQTKVFIDTVSNFMRKWPLESVGVHCTHGFNRTGFMLISYMVEAMDCSLEFAIREFAKIRPPGIYKQDYIDELFKRYGDTGCSMLAPMLPDWYTESDDSKGESSGSFSKGKKNKNMENKSFVLQPEIDGVFLFEDEPRASEITKMVQNMCGSKGSGFPGAQPVSMCMENIEKIQKMPYLVSWKADGNRYLMLIDGVDEVYLFDRDNCPYRVKNMRFPRKSNLRDHLKKTLLDGEMVIDRVGEDVYPRYLVYDIVAIEGEKVGNRPFPDRLNCIKSEIVEPRSRAIKEKLINSAADPFEVRDKRFYDISISAELLSESFINKLQHEPDGLIYQPVNDPYKPGTCDNILKWKPASLNSVDFKLKIVKESKPGMLPIKVGQLYVADLMTPFAIMKHTKALNEYDNKIIECHFDRGQWVFMRQRTDKSFPNSYKTAEAVVKSIKNPITEEILLKITSNSRFPDDTDRMPPPGKMRSDRLPLNYSFPLMPEVRDVSIISNENDAAMIRKKILHMCENTKGFPACQPSPLSMDNISKLNEKSYKVTWKADGIRFLMLIDGPNEIFLYDQDNNLYHVKNLRFPRKTNPDGHVKKTILDGELVLDMENGRFMPRFYCYDIIIFDGNRVRELPFYQNRLDIINSEIIVPRYQAMSQGKIDKFREPFSVRMQHYANVLNTRDLLSDNCFRAMCHEVSTLIFQPCKDPYITGYCKEVMRWRPPQMTSISFRLKIATREDCDMEIRQVGELYVKQSDEPFATIPYSKEIQDLDNKIIECKYEDCEWVFVRQRMNKTSPSTYETAAAVVELIDDPVMQDSLLDYIDKHAYVEDSERMPPPAKRHK